MRSMGGFVATGLVLGGLVPSECWMSKSGPQGSPPLDLPRIAPSRSTAETDGKVLMTGGRRLGLANAFGIVSKDARRPSQMYGKRVVFVDARSWVRWLRGEYGEISQPRSRLSGSESWASAGVGRDQLSYEASHAALCAPLLSFVRQRRNPCAFCGGRYAVDESRARGAACKGSLGCR